MANSSHLIYGNITILDKFLKSKKSEFDILQLGVPIDISRTIAPIQKLCKDMYCDIESGLYTKEDVLIYFLYNKIFNPKFYILQIIRKKIPSIVNLISNDQLEIDEKVVNNFMNDTKIKDLYELFQIIDGFNLPFHMVVRKVISPSFYLKNYKKYKYCKETKLNDDFIKFEKIINTIYKILKF